MEPNCLHIKVGIKTNGCPQIEKEGNHSIVKNMLIGDGFHWQKTIQATLPGEIVQLDGNQEGERFENQEHINLINILPIETYLECVVGSEMNPEAPSEFLKAHAVISRSWVVGKINGSHNSGRDSQPNGENILAGWDDTSSHKGFEVCSDDHCQRYQGIQQISPKSLSALRETEGEVLLTPDGEIVDARFSKCCGGITELFSTCWQSVDPDCLKSFKDPWCDLSGMSSRSRKILLSSILKDYDLSTEGYGFKWECEILKSDIEKNLLNKFGRSVGKVLKLQPLHRGPSGRIDLLRVCGSESHLDIGKELWIRKLLSPSHLYSSAFEIEDARDKIRLTGKGWGHGVGLCQIGAANMATNGFNYRDILSFYYPGSIVSKL